MSALSLVKSIVLLGATLERGSTAAVSGQASMAGGADMVKDAARVVGAGQDGLFIHQKKRVWSPLAEKLNCYVSLSSFTTITQSGHV